MKTLSIVLLAALGLNAADFSARFEEIKRTATPANSTPSSSPLPKGGDLHHHNGLSIYAKVWYAAATSPKTLARNAFYTMTRLGNCPDNRRHSASLLHHPALPL